MKHDISNETLTAYILGELDDAERKAVEDALEQDEVLRQTKAELEGTARIAKEVLHAEAAPELTQEQRGTIHKLADTQPETVAAKTRPRWRRYALVAAAALIIGFLPALYFSNLRHTQSLLSDKMEVSKAMEVVMRKQDARLSEMQKLADTPGSPAISEEYLAAAEESAEEVEFDDFDYSSGGSASGSLESPQVIAQTVDFAKKPKAGEEWRTGADARQSDPSQHPDFNNDPNKVYWPGHTTEAYDRIVENPFLDVVQNPLSTFSIDVDTASYSNMRRFLTQGALPPKGAVRIEELINYFSYDYTPPDVAPVDGGDPFAANVEVAGCPWNPQHRLARIGLKGWEIPRDERPPTNLVFLIDVSGSMSPDNKLPLLKKSMKMLVKRMTDMDHIAIAVYAGASGLVLPSTNGEDQKAILKALNKLESGGSTNGGAGIQLAYDTAAANFIEGGVNRVVLATDGDFNVGVTNQSQLVRMVEEKAKSGVFLTVLGFGMGNLKDSNLEKLADKGNGNYAYIDTLNEAKKVLVEEMSGTLVTIAKDVKIQVEFNPAHVGAYRLIGYENRILAAEDFNDDTKDAGEIGAGHTVTALYELVPAGVEMDLPNVDDLKYQQPKRTAEKTASDELLTLKLRYKQPDGDTSKKLVFPVVDDGKPWNRASSDFRFAAAVANFGMMLRDSEHKGDTSFDAVTEWAQEGRGEDKSGYRKEFLGLVGKAAALKR